MDRRTGTVYRSGQDGDPARPYDVGYLGRLPRPDGNGSLLAIAGIHTQGSLGVVQLLANDLNTLWGQVGDRRFSTLVGVEYDPETSEPQSVELLCPLYRHDEEDGGVRVALATLPAEPDRENEDFAAAAPGAAVLLDGAGVGGAETGLHAWRRLVLRNAGRPAAAQHHRISRSAAR